jgi:hypothetical protein
VGTHSELRYLDVIYRGFAVTATGSAMATLYDYGFDDRTGHLVVTPLEPFPVDPAANINYTLAPGATGPFATPEGKFLVVNPSASTTTTWRIYPEPLSTFTGPRVERLKWNTKGNRLYATDATAPLVHVFNWPALTPVTDIATQGIPIDLDVHPLTEKLSVITSAKLTTYAELPTFAVLKSISQSNLPSRLTYARHKNGKALAVLNYNTSLSFYDSETLCGIDADSAGFQSADLRFIDSGEFSNPVISNIAPLGCGSDFPDQLIQIIFEGLLVNGTTTLVAPNSLKMSTPWESHDVKVGDHLSVQGFPTEITGLSGNLLYFAPLTETPAPSLVTYEVRAAKQWTVNATSSGHLGRLSTGDTFSNLLTFTISDGGSPATRGDAFAFESISGISPAFLSGAPSDLVEDPYGRMLVPVPDNGQVRAVNIKEGDEGGWVIQTLYIIP